RRSCRGWSRRCGSRPAGPSRGRGSRWCAGGTWWVWRCARSIGCRGTRRSWSVPGGCRTGWRPRSRSVGPARAEPTPVSANRWRSFAAERSHGQDRAGALVGDDPGAVDLFEGQRHRGAAVRAGDLGRGGDGVGVDGGDLADGTGEGVAGEHAGEPVEHGGALGAVLHDGGAVLGGGGRVEEHVDLFLQLLDGDRGGDGGAGGGRRAGRGSGVVAGVVGAAAGHGGEGGERGGGAECANWTWGHGGVPFERNGRRTILGEPNSVSGAWRHGASHTRHMFGTRL